MQLTMDIMLFELIMAGFLVAMTTAARGNTKRCYACSSYMAQCKETVDEVKGYAHRGRCAGKCFVRLGEDGAIYRGCFDGFADVPYLQSSYLGCRNQTWNGQTRPWCMCDTDLCNKASMASLGLANTFQPPPPAAAPVVNPGINSVLNNAIKNTLETPANNIVNNNALKHGGYGMDGMTKFDSKVSREGSSDVKYAYNYGIQDYPLEYIDGTQGYVVNGDYNDDGGVFYEPVQYTYEFYPSNQPGEIGKILVRESPEQNNQQPEIQYQQNVAEYSNEMNEGVGDAMLSVDSKDKEGNIKGKNVQDVYITVDLTKENQATGNEMNGAGKMGLSEMPGKIEIDVAPTNGATLQQYLSKNRYGDSNIGKNSNMAGMQQGYQNNNYYVQQQQQGNYITQQNQSPFLNGYGSGNTDNGNPQLVNIPEKNVEHEYNNYNNVEGTSYDDPFYFPPQLAQKIECKKTGFYQNPDDCRTFVACILDPHIRRPYMHLMRCPDGLVWDNEEKLCNQFSSTCNAGGMTYDYQDYKSYSG